jgi:hypothetical protein
MMGAHEERMKMARGIFVWVMMVPLVAGLIVCALTGGGTASSETVVGPDQSGRNLGGATGSDPDFHYVAGTLAEHLSTNAAGRARGFTANYNSDMVEFVSPGGTNLDRLTKAVWYTNFWLRGVRGLSATPIGFSNAMGGQALPTMVSPRHYLFATHTHPEGHTLAFLDTNNVVHWRKTLQRADLNTDTSVGILDADLPASVGFLPVAPENLKQYLPKDNLYFVQGIGMNQDMRLFSLPMAFRWFTGVFWDKGYSAPQGLGTNWNVAIRGGDSSSPAMILIGNQLVLLSHVYIIGGGPDYTALFWGINEKMRFLSIHNHVGSDYQLTEYSLTNWPKLNR